MVNELPKVTRQPVGSWDQKDIPKILQDLMMFLQEVT